MPASLTNDEIKIRCRFYLLKLREFGLRVSLETLADGLHVPDDPVFKVIYKEFFGDLTKAQEQMCVEYIMQLKFRCANKLERERKQQMNLDGQIVSHNGGPPKIFKSEWDRWIMPSPFAPRKARKAWR